MDNFQLSFKIPSKGEIRRAIELSQENPDELTDRELWILEALGGDW